MADSKAFPPTADHTPAEPPPTPTINVTLPQPPPGVLSGASGPGAATEQTRAGWRPPASDITPPMSAPSEGEAPTRMQAAGQSAARVPGLPDIPGYEIIAEIGRGGMG